MTDELLWSFTYKTGEGERSLAILAATKEEAESALCNAVCEGSISPTESSVFASRQSDGECSPL